MKVIKREIKECDTKEGTKTKVLELEYTHRGETGRILVRDFIEEDEVNVMKQLRKAVKEAYDKKDEEVELIEDANVIKLDDEVKNNK